MALFACLSTVSAADNDTIYVNATGGDDNNNGTSWQYAKLSIKNATGTVNTNGVINLADGQYTGTCNTNITINKNMTITGQSQTGTIINGTGTNGIFYINPSVNVTIHNLTLTNGTGFDTDLSDTDGGAIYNKGTLSVTDCTFTRNTATYGGAICNEGNCNVSGSTFTGNNATSGDGGAISNLQGYNLTVSDCTFTGNNATSTGGAIHNWISTCTFNFNRFYNNTATTGNAIYNLAGSVNAENNWWGTNNPNWNNLIYGFDANPVWWIYMNLTANTTNILYGDLVNLTANFNYHSNGTDITPLTGGHIPDSEVIFASNDGNLNPLSKTTMNGLASSIFTPNLGPVKVNATLDNQICSLIINVGKGISSVSVDSVHNFAGQTVNLTATIVDQNGKPIQYGLVTFKVGAYTSLPVTISNGKSIYTWQIPANWNVGNYTILANYTENSDYIASSGIGNLTVTKTPTNLTTSNITGNKCKTITLNAALTDYYGTPLNNKIIEFYINNIKVGQNSTNSKGIATFNYNITQIGGIYNITVKFLGDSRYLASISNGTLKVNHSSVYVNVTASKTNPTVGETIILTFKLGNNGPDPADDVVFTYMIPEGMEFVSIDTEPGYQQATYNPTTRTITWPLGTVPLLDPWIKLNVRILNSGAFNINPTVTTSTYDPTLGNNIQQITINAVQTTSATSTIRTIGMQETGLPIAGLILAILAVLGGLITPKRK